MVIETYPPLAFNEIGRRSQNEDFIYPSLQEENRQTVNHNNLFIVCDGLGGAEKGEEASKIVCKTFASSLEGLDIIFEHDFERALEMAETRIDEYVEAHPEAEGMATTLALLAIDTKGIKIAHIGDSRVYHLRGEKVLFKTYDHSLVNEMVSNNIITEAEAVNHPKKNVVSRAIMGSHRPTKIELNVLLGDIQPEDYFFLCTDGVLESITDGLLVEIISKPNSEEDKMNEILSICGQFSKDNYSAYLVKIKSVFLQDMSVNGSNHEVEPSSLPQIENPKRPCPKEGMLPKWAAYTIIALSVLALIMFLLTMNSMG